MRTILLIHDDAAAAALVMDALGQSRECRFEVEWLRHCSEGVKRLSSEAGHGREPVAAVLAAIRLPDSRGIATFDSLFQAAPLLPILLISELEDEPIARLAVQRGAQDYLLMGHLHSYLLAKTVRNMIERPPLPRSCTGKRSGPR